MNKEEILRDYNKTTKEIASILGCSTATVSRWRKNAGISGPKGSKKGVAKPKNRRTKDLVCPECNSLFTVIPSKKQLYCSISCAAKNNDKSYMQTEAYRKSLMKSTTKEYRRYRNRVTKLTEKIYLENIDILNPQRLPRTVCGVSEGYQLDHIISVRNCFDLGWTPEEASKLENLQLLPWKINLTKR